MMKAHQIVGWIVGIGVFIGGQTLVPAAVCSDGWASPSIGRQGACSHHGGVSGASGLIGTLVFFASIWAGVSVANKLDPDPKPPTRSDNQAHRRPPAQKRWYTDKNGRRHSYW